MMVQSNQKWCCVMLETKRTKKNSVFAYLFSQPEYMLQLYQVLHPEDMEAREEDFKQIITQGNALADERCSDLGFQVRDKLIVLMEAQSELSRDTPMRMLLRLGDAYKDFVIENKLSLYQEKPVSIPRPELYVVYTGTEAAVPEVLRLGGPGFVEAEVTVLRNDGSGNILDQYIQFCEVLNKQTGLYGRTDEALSSAMHICIEQGVLASFLNSHMEEVAQCCDVGHLPYCQDSSG